MFSILDRGISPLTRREWLRIGGFAGLMAPTLFSPRRAQAAPAPTVGGWGKAKSCIVVFMEGGPPQHETWDPKPDAPTEIRGDLKPIHSATPGLMVGELMPRTAALMDKIAVLRAVTTGDNNHDTSHYYMQTGRRLDSVPKNWPCVDAVIKWRLRNQKSVPAVNLPHLITSAFRPGQDAGLLGRAYDPWLLKCDPNAPDFEVSELNLPADMPPLRFDHRRALLDQVNQHFDSVQRDRTIRDYGAQSQQAFDMIASPEGRRVFDMHHESPRVRERYGRNRWGQSLLLARRLVEAGVPFVRVNWVLLGAGRGGLGGSWDTHEDNTANLKDLMPIMDQGYTALLEDLSQRGLLDQTMVFWMGEFGRTPRIGTEGARRLAGRDHWGNVFSVAVSGGGVQGGRVIGASDRIGGYPLETRVLPEDLIATMFHSLGIPTDTELQDRQGRPLVSTQGQVIRQLF